MSTYKKRTSTRDARFKGRVNRIISGNEQTLNWEGIYVPDNEVICNSCNKNIHDEEEALDTFGWLIYFDKRDVKADRPYDIYCDECCARVFPKAIEVT